MLSKWQICKKQKSDKLNILSTVELWYNKLCSEFPRNFIEYEWLWHSEWSALKLTSSQQNASRTSPRILGVIFFNLLITLPFDRSSGNLSKVILFSLNNKIYFFRFIKSQLLLIHKVQTELWMRAQQFCPG